MSGPRSVTVYPLVYRYVQTAATHSTTAWCCESSRSRAPSSESVMDLTPDWVVTRKNRGSIGTPISDAERMSKI